MISNVQLSFSCHRVSISFISDCMLHRFLTCCSQREIQNKISTFQVSLALYYLSLVKGGCKNNSSNIYNNSDIKIINIALCSCKFLKL